VAGFIQAWDMRTAFWISLSIVVYVYIGYPLLLLLIRRIQLRPLRRAEYEPHVTILIAARNERDRIERKLWNCFELDYPRRKLQIVVALDGPTDGTESVVWRYANQGVRMVHSQQHRGKPSALNKGIRCATGTIVVFADARQTFAKDAIRQLVRNFADPDVGAVSGELMLVGPNGEEATSDIGMYWKYEKWIRSMESDIHSVIGATGAIYAIRRELYLDLPEGTLLDDVFTPMSILFEGRRVVFEPGAKAFDAVSCCPRAEFDRKVRTLAGNVQIMVLMPRLLVPWRNPVFWQFCSHKVGRLLVPYLLVVMLVSNALAIGGIYSWLFAAQCAWYACAAAGYLAAKRTAVETSAGEQHRRAA
jgi:poly-beta-1,6-N-acetyl-D-glucosamine synthase